jgi:hypothetical protein
MIPRQEDNREIMEETFSTQSVQKCYKQESLEIRQLVTELMAFNRYELLLLHAGSWGRIQFGYTEESEPRPMRPQSSNDNGGVTLDICLCKCGPLGFLMVAYI